MDRLFRIDFYPHDWLIDTSALTPQDRGIYIQIVALIYAKRGPIDHDLRWLANACNCSARLVDATISRLVQLGFIQTSSGKIGQRRAEHELNTKRDHLHNSAKGGRKSRENRPELNKNNVLNSSDPPKPLPTPKATATATATAKESLGEATASPPRPNASLRLDVWMLQQAIDDIPHDWGMWAVEHQGLTSVEVNAEWEKFLDFWKADGRASARKRDWEATWRNWVRRSAEFKQQRKG